MSGWDSVGRLAWVVQTARSTVGQPRPGSLPQQPPGLVLCSLQHPEEGPGKAHPPVSTSVVQGLGLQAARDPAGPMPGSPAVRLPPGGEEEGRALGAARLVWVGPGGCLGRLLPPWTAALRSSPWLWPPPTAVPPGPGVRPPLVRSLPRLWRLTPGARASRSDGLATCRPARAFSVLNPRTQQVKLETPQEAPAGRTSVGTPLCGWGEGRREAGLSLLTRDASRLAGGAGPAATCAVSLHCPRPAGGGLRPVCYPGKRNSNQSILQ